MEFVLHGMSICFTSFRSFRLPLPQANSSFFHSSTQSIVSRGPTIPSISRIYRIINVSVYQIADMFSATGPGVHLGRSLRSQWRAYTAIQSHQEDSDQKSSEVNQPGKLYHIIDAVAFMLTPIVYCLLLPQRTPSNPPDVSRININCCTCIANATTCPSCCNVQAIFFHLQWFFSSCE